MDGRPFDFQDEDLQEPAEAELDGRVVTVAPREEAEEPVLDKTEKRLRFAGEWGPEPAVTDQETFYEDTIRTTRIFFEVLDAKDANDAIKYTKYAMSNLNRGRYVFTASPEKQFVSELKTWLIFLSLEEREFKQL